MIRQDAKKQYVRSLSAEAPPSSEPALSRLILSQACEAGRGRESQTDEENKADKKRRGK